MNKLNVVGFFFMWYFLVMVKLGVVEIELGCDF